MRLFTALLISIFIAGCSGDGKQKEIDKIADEVLELHDEVMPLTDDLYKTRIKLVKLLESDTSRSAETSMVIKELSDGESAMMDWMHNFNLAFEGESKDDTYSYFVDQKKSIEQVTEQMHAALRSGEAELAKF